MVRATGDFFVSGAVSLAADGAKLIPAIDAVLTVRGKLVNQPPTAVADPNRAVECSSPRGTHVALDAAASTDPDDDVLAFTWREGDPHFGHPIGFTATATTIQGIGTADYGVSVADKKLQVATAVTRVTVVDTTPPTFSDFSLTKTICLWPPDHRFAVLRVPRDLVGMVVDACDEHPSLEITQAVSDQAANDLGDGDTMPDIKINFDTLCLRSERQGPQASGRSYTVKLRAGDASGNATVATLKILVPHDRADFGALGCEELVVTEPAEDPSACEVAAEPNRPVFRHEGPPRGCSSAPGSLWLFLTVLYACRSRRGAPRKSPLAITAILAITSCAPQTPTDSALFSCAKDMWLGLAAPCGCIETRLPPECSQSDCREQKFVWVSSPMLAAEGFVTISATGGTFSSLGVVAGVSATASAGKLMLGTTERQALCDGDTLTLGGIKYTRAPPGMSRSLESAWNGSGEWQGLRVNGP